MGYNGEYDASTIKRAELTLKSVAGGEWKPPVSVVEIMLEPSSIPTVTVHVAPGFDADDQSPAPQRPTLQTFNAWLARALAYTVDKTAKANLSLDVWANAPEHEQFLDLHDWSIIGAGLDGLSTQGGLSLRITLAHPAYALAEGSGAPGNLKEPPDFDVVRDKPNILEALRAALQSWAEAERKPADEDGDACYTEVEDAEAVETTLDKLLARVKESLTQLRNTLVWDTALPRNTVNYGAWPTVGDCLADHVENIAYSLTQFAGGMESVSLMDILTTIIHEFQLAIVPTFWKEQLQVMPFSPWAHPAIQVGEYEIANFVFPGIDPAPVAGLRMPYVSYQGVENNTYLQADDDTPAVIPVPGEVLYVPQKLLDNGLIGAFTVMSPPSWWTAAQENTGGTGMNNSVPSYNTDDIGPEEPAEPPQPEDTRRAFVGALSGVARQYFLTLFKQQVEVAFATPLRIKSQGSFWEDNWVTPGCVARIFAGPEQSPMLDCYLTRVVHTINIAESRAATTWTGNWCRPPDGYAGLAENGDYNPLYLKA